MWEADVRARLKTSVVWRYGLPVISVAAALAATYLLQPYVFRTPLFFLAILISAWVGGTGPGLLAVLLSTLCINFFLNPQGVLVSRFPNVSNVAAFLVTSLMVSAWSAARRRAEDALQQARYELETKVQERTADLSRSNDQLQKEINERKRAEEALREREELMRMLTENANDFIRLHNIEGRSVYASPSVKRLYGRLPTTLFELAHPEDEEACQRWWEQAVAGGSQRLHWRVRDGSGKWRWLETAASRFQFKGQPHVLTVCRDITERKRAEGALDERLRFETLLTELSATFANTAASEVDQEIDKWLQSLAEVLEVDRATFFHVREDGTTLYRSHSYTAPGIEPLPLTAINDQFPWTTEQLLQGNTVKWLRVPDDLPEQATQEKAFAARVGVKSTLSIPVLIGGSVICALSFTSIRAFRNWPDEMVARLRLVGEIFAAAVARKRAEKALKESQHRLEEAHRIAHIGHWERDLETGLITWSDEIYRILGLPQEPDSPLTEWQHMLHPEDREKVALVIEEAQRGVRRYDVEYRIVRSDGQVRFLHSQGDIIRDEQGRPLRAFGIAQDITERKRAEEALRQAEEKYHGIFEHAIEGIFQTTPDGQYITVNPALARMLGYDSPQELMSSRTDIERQQYVEPERRSDFKRLLEEHSVVQGFEYQAYRKDGSRIWLSDNGRAVRDESGAVLYYEGFTKDITERKLAEEMLQTFSQRLIEAQEAERRRVARALHDEIGQALTAIKLNLQAVQQSADTPPLAPQLNESVGIIDSALQQVHDLSFDLRPSLLDDLGLVAALRWYVDREARRAGLIPEFVADLSETRLPPELETACFRITQEALTNVVRHAQARRVGVELRQRGSELHLVVRDDGIGFDVSAARRRHASDVSLGLQGMQERALILGGKIEITSTRARGTEIHAWFPMILSGPPNRRESDPQ